MAKKNWIQGAIKHKGALRRSLKVKSSKNIPKSKLKIKKTDKGVTRKRKALAKTLRSFKSR